MLDAPQFQCKFKVAVTPDVARPRAGRSLVLSKFKPRQSHAKRTYEVFANPGDYDNRGPAKSSSKPLIKESPTKRSKGGGMQRHPDTNIIYNVDMDVPYGGFRF